MLFQELTTIVCSIFSSDDLDIVTNASDETFHTNDDVDQNSSIAESQQTQNIRRKRANLRKQKI